MNHQAIILLYIFINLNTEVQTYQWSVATQDKCQFTTNSVLFVYFSEQPTLFVNSLKTSNLAACRMECCNHETCNGYVWQPSNIDNCRLLKCASLGEDCKKALKPANEITSEVGFITGYSDSVTTTTTVAPLPKQAEKSKIQEMQWLKQKLQGLASKQPINKNKVAQTNSTMKGNISLRKDVKKSVTNLTHANNTLHLIKHGQIVTTILHTTVVTPIVVIKKVTIIPPNIHSTHTNTVSLIAAFLIGTAFFVTIFIMVGRRWVEGVKDYHQRGYTRISFLLNGV